jgi:hypothetical protein
MMNLRIGISIFTLSIWLFQPAPAVADTTTTNSTAINLTIDGVQYENVRWRRATPSTVTIFHKTGVASIPLWKLPPDLQKKFGYDPQKAAEWDAQQRAAAEQMAQQRHVLRSNLPSGVSFAIVSETGSSEPFVPFERLQFQIAFEDPGSYQKLLQEYYKFSLSGRSTINGRPFPKSVLESVRTYGSGEVGKIQRIEWRPVRGLLPPQTGKYTIQVVLDTPKGSWITPMMTIEMSLPEADRASLKFLVEKRGDDFFSREVVLRTRTEGHLRQPPYSVIKEFIKTYPDSSINMLIVRHAEHARALDGSWGPNYYLDQDREQLAEIIALAHPSIVQELERQRDVWKQSLSETSDQNRSQLTQKDIDSFDRWIALVTKYTQ